MTANAPANAPANASPAPGRHRPPPSLERLARSRRLRILLAGGLAACGLWAFAPYAMSEVGGEAFVNAPLTRIASPIAGTVAPDLPEAGSFIAHQRRLRLVTARSLETDALGALLSQAAALRAGLALAIHQLDEVHAADDRMAARAGAYRRVAVDRFAAGSKAADADAAACAVEPWQRVCNWRALRRCRRKALPAAPVSSVPALPPRPARRAVPR